MAVMAGETRRDLVRLIERVNLDGTAVEIVSKSGYAVLMSKPAYDALMETSYLLHSAKNADRLMSALRSDGQRSAPGVPGSDTEGQS